jgi:dipeptidyl-peptidase 4
MADSFPRQQARTRRFSLGVPRTFTVSRDGSRVLFLRSPSGSDPATALWAFEVDGAKEVLLADGARLDVAGELTAEELALRERRRERASGITSYSPDADAARVVFALGGELWLTEVAGPESRRLEVPGPVFDPRIDPSGRHVAWCRGPELWALDLEGGQPRLVGGPVDDDLLPAGGLSPEPAQGGSAEAGTVTWGQAEFIAAEEMRRDRGHWWLEGGDLLAARVDVASVGVWWVADPAHPDRPPTAHRYPSAGTADAEVTLWVCGVDGDRREVTWDREAFGYLVAVQPGPGAPLLLVERRDHHECQVLEVDVTAGTTRRIGGLEDDAWVDWPQGVPARLPNGQVLWTVEQDGYLVLTLDGDAITPSGLDVRAVVDTDSGVWFTASREPTEIDLYRWSPDGVVAVATGGVVGAAAVGGATATFAQRRLEEPGVRCRVVEVEGPEIGVIESFADPPFVEPSVRLMSIGPDELRTGVVLPRGHRPGTPLPVLMCPYGGPSAQMVLADHHAWLEAQWRADQGFAVVVCDGRGSPGRGRRWDRRIYQDFSDGVLEDQVTALRGAAATVPDLDLSRVGITGWSFGGYLAALAVLRRPEVFHAAVAGAPVTEWRLYDTYYTERYLGHPDGAAGVYDHQSLLLDAERLERPLLLIHGLVDDNVVVAHTLQLSQRLLEAGRSHAVVPLSGVTHMASQEEVAENLLLLQTRFLADALGVARPGDPSASR